MRVSRIKLSFLQLLLAKHRLGLEETGLRLNKRELPFPKHNQVCNISSSGMLLKLHWGDHHFVFWRQRRLADFLDLVINKRDKYWHAQYLPSFERLRQYADELDQRLRAQSRYIRSSQLEQVLQSYEQLSSDLELLPTLESLGFNTQAIERKLQFYLIGPSSFQDRFNAQWMQEQLTSNRTLFESLEEHPLTEAQRMACVQDEDNVLVIAGAGTGKTSTMVAKARYLVDNGFAAPDEIMMLAFGKDARKELGDRTAQHPSIEGVKVSTFHSAGFKILNYCERGTYLTALASDDILYSRYVEQQIEALVSNNDIAEDLSRYVGQFYYPKPDNIDVSTQAEYNTYIRNTDIRALSGDQVKSFEELTIANYLYRNGIAFEYERPYPHSNSEHGRKTYQPDFYLPDFDLYIEHFGINKSGETRPDIDADAYKEDMDWKIEEHTKHDTALLQTFSYQTSEPGGLTQSLERRLQEHCKQQEINFDDMLSPINHSDLFIRLKELGIVSRLGALLARFLQLFKASPLGLEAIRLGQLSDYNCERWVLFKKIFAWVYERYQATLTANKSIDFADMINKATLHAESPDFHRKTENTFRIKYLLVDEFQDISANRAAFIQAISSSNDNCAIMGVGDDWQAIFRFAGSDVRLTTQFEQYFGATSVINLDKTFRFNDRIERVASTFVQANPHQIKKVLSTHSKSANPEVCIISQKPDIALEQALAQIAKRCPEQSCSVMIIGRYKESLSDEEGISRYTKLYPQLRISRMTAHKSKGKQADFVIVTGVNDGAYGFPSQLTTDPLLETLLPKLENYQHAEERRLFYVALSRAKQSVYVLTELGKESIFVKELKQQKDDVSLYLSDLEDSFVDNLRCPECLVGNLIPIEGKYGLFYGCSEPPHVCKHTVNACKVCQHGPLIRTDTNVVCAAPDCSNVLELCPICGTGMLVERERVSDKKNFLGCSNYRTNSDVSCSYTQGLAVRQKMR